MILPRMAVAATALLLLAACSPAARNDPPGAASATSSAAPVAATGTSPADPAGVKACDAVKRANVGAGFADPAVALAVEADAKQSTDLSIRISGALLGESARLAAAAKGAPDEVARTLDVGTAALKLETACTTAGYYRTP